ncbi:hypothetical protein PGT21_022566 [Puccinia graminis f. sp. tritici]|uniref:Uncharacterized protein n=1 Tax=Puccinia graminis f. sp. tritici TaxID=56615 RepID=A0A5B0S5Q9_PUCGR|nr:hypothetical protein PGT21_022566 [Puccinia graminis f. sp. tritici]KAA1132809.1 hypothetical protein PGTUg99_017745 [Puccinia graminis f. sp. tritici]
MWCNANQISAVHYHKHLWFGTDSKQLQKSVSDPFQDSARGPFPKISDRVKIPQYPPAFRQTGSDSRDTFNEGSAEDRATSGSFCMYSCAVGSQPFTIEFPENFN